MYGYQIGSLTVLIKFNDGTTKQLWQLSGNQQDAWYSAVVRLGVANQQFQILFNVTSGGGYGSDIAIDDIGFVSCNPGNGSYCILVVLGCLNTLDYLISLIKRYGAYR